MTRLPLFLCAALMLAACATPREACETDAAAPYRAALAEQARNARDLERGFVYKTRFEKVTRRATCRIAGGGVYPCFREDMQPVTRKVPVDVRALTARQRELARALPGLRRTASTETAQCHALYPAQPA
ncbi:excinuclease ABC subunit B [Thalassococcus sp. BH17M4-6]|uniref:excinuclease ABC subunit B n=1 Tax=Thalassococcus sp. BH17M4-6 TaxID=3413148 RepID=UPI003BD081E1